MMQSGTENLGDIIYSAQQLLFNWSLYTSLVMRDLTCRDSASSGTLKITKKQKIKAKTKLIALCVKVFFFFFFLQSRTVLN